MPSLSIIVPVHNELIHGFIQKQIKVFEGIADLEVLFIDGGSSDQTIEFLQENNQTVHVSKDSNRAQRLNEGIKLAAGDLILLHHPRSLITKEGISHLLENSSKYTWGGFTHRFDEPNYLLKFTSWYSNEVRAKIRSIIYLDHCVFFKKEYAKTKALVPDIPIFEDTALSEKLACFGPPSIISFPSTTSAIRFKKNGLLFQSLLNQVLKICWALKISPEQMNKIYEKGLELNSRV